MIVHRNSFWEIDNKINMRQFKKKKFLFLFPFRSKCMKDEEEPLFELFDAKSHSKKMDRIGDKFQLRHRFITQFSPFPMKNKLVLVARAIFADDCWLAIKNTYYIVSITFCSFCIRFSLKQFSIVGMYSTFNVHCISLHKFIVIYFFVCVSLFSFVISLESFVRDTWNTWKTFASEK